MMWKMKLNNFKKNKKYRFRDCIISPECNTINVFANKDVEFYYNPNKCIHLLNVSLMVDDKGFISITGDKIVHKRTLVDINYGDNFFVFGLNGKTINNLVKGVKIVVNKFNVRLCAR